MADLSPTATIIAISFAALGILIAIVGGLVVLHIMGRRTPDDPDVR